MTGEKLLSCLYAHSDKLTKECSRTIAQANEVVQGAIANASFAFIVCSGDLAKLCSDVEPGEGRMLQCARQNQEQLQDSCVDALKNTGFLQ